MIATPVFPDLAALVADESLYMRRILRDMLTRVGIKRVFEAPDGAEALGVLPIILMLSKPRRYAVDRAVALGVNEVIGKPFSPKILWSRLDEVLNRPRGFVEANGLLRPAPRGGAAAEKAAA